MFRLAGIGPGCIQWAYAQGAAPDTTKRKRYVGVSGQSQIWTVHAPMERQRVKVYRLQATLDMSWQRPHDAVAREPSACQELI